MNRYIDISLELYRDCIAYIFIGGRGIGKTYSALKYVMQESETFLYLRRSQTELDICVSKSGNPFKKLNIDFKRDFEILGGKICEIVEGKDVKGYACALSTFSNVRGADFSDVKTIIYDEFIPEKSNKCHIKNEWDALLNLIETVNRNREIDGEKSVKVVMLSNATNIDCDILIQSGLTSVIERMIARGQKKNEIKERSIFISLQNSGISDEKKETKLYKMAGQGTFSESALSNSFSYDNDNRVKAMKLNEFVPFVQYEKITFYRHKSNGCVYIVLSYNSGIPFFGRNERGFFRRCFITELREKEACGKIFFDSYISKKIYNEIM